MDEQLVNRLVGLIQGGLQQNAPAKPALRIVRTPDKADRNTLDWVTRESHCKMIRHLAKRYNLRMLVDQATFGRGSIDDLGDSDLVRLHADLQRARECIEEGITLEEAGLIRSRA